jgi:hypothetical protein
MSTMKYAAVLLCFLTFGPFARAGVFGSFTSKEATWAYVQQTGGLKIADPTQRDGRWILPVEYEPHGTRTVTRRPTLVNSAPQRCRLKLLHKESQLFLTVTTSLARKGTQSGFLHEASLTGIPPGTYEVFYGREALGDRALGKITVPGERGNASQR